MTLDLTKLSSPSLDAVRQNLGAEGEDDTSKDDWISKITPMDFVKCYTAWHLGSRTWGTTLYNVVHEADEAQVKP